MKSKLRVCVALVTMLISLSGFSTVAYAGGGEEYPDVPMPTQEVTEPEPTPEATDNSFTPPGTGTVVDTATDADGKEFYTITTADEHVFYLIIDRQRESENVYFLNAVTVQDLVALAEEGETGESVIPTPPPETTPPPVTETPDPEPEVTPEPEKSGSGGTIFFVLLAVLAAGGVGYYLKVYKPKKQRAIEAR